jgi:hypothetical protein
MAVKLVHDYRKLRKAVKSLTVAFYVHLKFVRFYVAFAFELDLDPDPDYGRKLKKQMRSNALLKSRQHDSQFNTREGIFAGLRQ